ncbi:MAG: sigma-54 dependent transcriptional regulator [Pseudomonadota bacterium]
MSRMYVLLFDPDLRCTQIFSSVTLDGVVGVTAIPIPEKYVREWVRDWEGHMIINDHNSEDWFWDHIRAINYRTDISVLILRLKVDESYCMVGLIENGQGIYSEEHARLMELLKKPFSIVIANALRQERLLRLEGLLVDERRRIHESEKGIPEVVLDRQLGLRPTLAKCRQAASIDSPVLLLGETGVGKDLLARTIHRHSRRRHNPFIPVNCGALTETLLDSELFGHEKGAFTGAVGRKMGRFERADTGTIYLDEIGDLPPQGQVRLLRVLQYKEIERVGGTMPVLVDARVIAATNRDLEAMVKSGKFRSDLWYRLNVFPITIPPLRERKQDLPDLLYSFIDEKKQELRLNITPRLTPNAVNRLMAYDWPGNVRELKNIVERSLITNRDGLLPLEELLMIRPDLNHQPSPAADSSFFHNSQTLDEIISAHIRQAMIRAHGKINGPGGAAELLGINPNTLRKRMDKLGIAYKKRAILTTTGFRYRIENLRDRGNA